MSNFKKLMMTAAGAGGGLNVEEVFSTYLYQGDDANAQVISNGIDLYNEGGLVWTKSRDAVGHALISSEDYTKKLQSNITAGYQGTGTLVPDAGGNGYTVPYSDDVTNYFNYLYASWTFRKAPKFFDVVTWTGNNVQGRSISHNLGSVPGVIITKKLNGADNWVVYHRSRGAGKMLYLNGTNSSLNSTAVYPTTPTDSVFYVGNDSAVNGTSSDTYVAYLFAHNDGDGEFGPTGDQDIIKCGSYTGNSSNDGPEIDLGFEPQFLIIKAAERTANWYLWDTMRGFTAADVANSPLYPNSSLGEYTGTTYVAPTATGFKITDSANDVNSGLAGYNNYIYIAIRRGPMAVPESATDVFVTRYRGEDAVSQPPMFYSGWPVDMAFQRSDVTSTSENRFSTRLTGQHFLDASTTEAEQTGASSYKFDYQDGWVNATGNVTTYRSWMWRRAPNFFDVVAYTGNGTAGRTVSHNLGAAPEMMWIKSRNVGSTHWVVYHSGLGNDKFAYLSATNAAFNDASPTAWDFTTPSSADFTLGAQTGVNQSGYNYIAYLFASLAGVSKVGSYTGNGNASQNIDCGFSSGARFVLVKTTNIGSWFFFDTERGIVAGNDSRLELNATSAEVTNADVIDPYSSGFAVTNNSIGLNISGREYIFYAIA